MTQSSLPDDPLEWLKQLTAGFGAPALSAFDPARFDRQIADLKAVEGWLDAQLGLLRLAIQTLETQRATLQVMGASAAPVPGQQTAEMPPHSLDMWAQLLQQMQDAAAGREKNDK